MSAAVAAGREGSRRVGGVADCRMCFNAHWQQASERCMLLADPARLLSLRVQHLSANFQYGDC